MRAEYNRAPDRCTLHNIALHHASCCGVVLGASCVWPGWFELASETSVLMVFTISAVSSALRRPRGRPKKFDEPARAVSLTLPESVIAQLSRLHADLGRAVVSLLARKTPAPPRPGAQLVVYGKRAVISVRSTPTLESRTGVQLVPLPDGRALISFEAPQTIADLELNISDALEDTSLPQDDRAVFESILGILRDARRAKDVSLVRRSIIVLEGNTHRPRPGIDTKTAGGSRRGAKSA